MSGEDGGHLWSLSPLLQVICWITTTMQMMMMRFLEEQNEGERMTGLSVEEDGVLLLLKSFLTCVCVL